MPTSHILSFEADLDSILANTALADLKWSIRTISPVALYKKPNNKLIWPFEGAMVVLDLAIAMDAAFEELAFNFA